MVSRFSHAALVSLILGVSSVSAATPNDFDINRYNTAGEGMFKTFHVETALPLHEARDTDIVEDATELLVVDTAAGRLALIKDQMAFHHIAQGRAAGKDWMTTF